MTLRITKPLDQFSWQPQPRAQQLVFDLLAQFLSRSPQTAKLAERMHDETGTRLIDWIDHFAVPHSSDIEQQLKLTGFTQISLPGADRCFTQEQGIFPVIVLTDGGQFGRVFGGGFRHAAAKLGLDIVGPLYATKTEFGQKFREIVASEGVPAAVKWRAAQFRD